jgi:hypothetical protein
MPTIILTDGQKALVSVRDYGFVSKFKWSSVKKGRNTYAQCNLGGLLPQRQTHTVGMHRMIAWLCGLDKRRRIDHINQNGLDNRRQNLRLATHRQNLCNRGATIASQTGCKGISWHTPTGKFHVRIRHKYKQHYIGLFPTLTEAKKAYNKAARKFHGNFAYQHKV